MWCSHQTKPIDVQCSYWYETPPTPPKLLICSHVEGTTSAVQNAQSFFKIVTNKLGIAGN